MLYEIECDQFAETINGQRVPRGRIRFRPGLNTVLGDRQGENSIGKSTFLLTVDFCFGGNPEGSSPVNADQLLEDSGLDYTTLRLPWLNDRP